MKKRYMDRFVGKYCKIVTKEPGESRASVVVGLLEDIDYEDGFILIDSDQGLGAVRIKTIVAIKPSNKKRKRNNTATIGIGTLIVFIAMVLVAAVAASVIIQTSENLQNRAYAVGKQTIREVSSGVQIVDQIGYTNEEKTVVQYLAISIRPRAGSYDIDLNETLIYLQYDNLTVLSLNYHNGTDSVISSVNNDGVFHTLNMSVINANEFGAIGIRDSDRSIQNTYGMGSGDMAMIIINLSAAFPDTNGLVPGEALTGRLVPEIGAAGIFLVSAPNAFDNRVVEL
jgi:flagellin FlaB